MRDIAARRKCPSSRFPWKAAAASQWQSRAAACSSEFTLATDISVIPTEAKAEEIRKSAEQFLSAKGYPGCELSYAQYYGGDALLNFVPLQDGVRLYPDLLKVWVQVDSMQVVGLDASAYVKNNRPRTLEQTAALHDARAVLPAEAAETDCAMAVIPKESGIEVYCYEFFCNFSGRDAIVYVNAKNGSVEDILRLCMSTTAL